MTIPGQFRFLAAPGSDWCGLYHDGRLIHQGHEISAYQLLEILKADLLESIDVDTEDMPARIDMKTGKELEE